jgi:hypothetical protein
MMALKEWTTIGLCKDGGFTPNIAQYFWPFQWTNDDWLELGIVMD